MFVASDRLLLFDHFRVPYRIDGGLARDGHPLAGFACVTKAGSQSGGPSIYWPAGAPGPHGRGDVYRYGTTPLYAAVAADRELAPRLAAVGRAWRPVARVQDAGGRPVASVWRDANGSVVLPFDPNAAIRNLLSEAYVTASTPALVRRGARAARSAYYCARPLMPRRLQIAQRRLLSHAQARSRFPAWPFEPALHDLCDELFALVADFAQTPVPRLAAWPDGNLWAFVLTHDVETRAGLIAIDALRDREERAGLRSSWNLVGGRYTVDQSLVAELLSAGFEVGVHGLHHDGRDLKSRELLEERLPAMRRHAARWGACGFRSPATQRAWNLMPLLGFDYDSSYPDTDPFEPQAGGCCSWLPFFNEDLVELPITLPQDHTLFTILRQTDASTWIDKARRLRARGGMALLNTHPDYAAGGPLLDAYDSYLRYFEADDTAWRALPREVSAWWRRRAASAPERVGGRWTVAGPARGEATVEVVQPPRALALAG